MRYHFAHIRRLLSNKTKQQRTNNKCCEGGGKLESLCITGENVKWTDKWIHKMWYIYTLEYCCFKREAHSETYSMNTFL